MADSNMSQWDDRVLRAVRRAATRSHAAQRGFVELEDLQQEGYLYVAENLARVNEYVENGREGENILTTILYRAMHRYTMRQRYERDGTKPGDYFTYQYEVIRELLPEALDTDLSFTSSTSDLSGVRSGKAPNEGGDRLAMLADVRAALSALQPTEQNLLRAKFGQGEVVPDVDLAVYYEVSTDSINRGVKRALRKMARFLGSEPLPRRMVMSNAQAQHVTREQEQ